jgi:hypothetical protein
MLAGDVIDDGILGAYPFIREDNLSPASLLRTLSTVEKEVISWYIRSYPERISVASSAVPVVLASNLAGYTLTSARAYYNFKYQNTDGYEEDIDIVPHGKRPTRHPAAYIVGNTLFPIDPLERNWAENGSNNVYFRLGDTFSYDYIAEPAQIVSKSATLASPDEVRPYLESVITLQVLLQNAGNVPQDRMQAQYATVQQQKQNFLFLLSKRIR